MPSSPIPITVSSSLSLAPNISNSTGRKSSLSHPGNNPVCLITFLFRRRPNTTKNDSTSSIIVVEDNFAEEETNQNSGNLKGYISPYYRGLLTNDSPTYYYDFVGERQHKSHAKSVTSTTTKASLASSIITKFQQLGNSCYKFKRSRKQSDDDDDDDDGHVDVVHEPGQKETASASAGLSDATKSVTTTTALSSSSSKNVTTDVDVIGREERSNSQEKPLRESVTETGSAHAVPNLAAADQPQPVAGSPLEDVPAASDENTWEEDEKEFVWADKYRPTDLKDFMCNKSKADQLQAMARNGGECGHFIFQGPPGVGKRTMIWALLREVFGSEYGQAHEVSKVFHLKGELVGSVAVTVKESRGIVEVNLSEVKGYEKHVIYELMKENTRNISNNSALPCKLPPGNCRATIFYGVDKLSTDAILYIQWLLERYNVCGAIFFCCEEISKLQAIKPLCTVVHLLPPSTDEVIDVLNFIATKEGIELPIQLALRIAHSSNSNLRQAIRSFEATWRKYYPFKEDQEVLTGWEDDIVNIAKKMVHEQSPKQLYMIRGKLENLIEHDVSPEFIFQSLVDELKRHLDDLLRRRVHILYQDYNKTDESVFQSDKMMVQTRSNSSIRDQFSTIEEFIAKFMSCYKAETTKSAHHDSDDHDSEE